MRKSIVAAVLFLSIVSHAWPVEKILKLGHLVNKENVWHLASLKFGEELEKLSNGRLKVEIFPNESLGKELDLITGMQLGTVDMTISGESLQNWAPMAALLAIPYAYTSLKQMDDIARGEIGKEIEKQIIEKARVRPIAYFLRGPRNLTSNRPIRRPSDLKKLKLRVPNVPLFIKVWKGLGAQPIPMAFSEVFTSLQNHTIDAQENPLALVKSGGFDEVQRYVNLTEHVRSWTYLVISEKIYSALSEKDKGIVMEAASKAQIYERPLFLENEKKLRDELEIGRRMTFVDSDKASFKRAGKRAVLASVSRKIRPTVRKIFAEQ